MTIRKKTMNSNREASSTQDVQLMACRSMVATAPLIPMRIVDIGEVFTPLEKTRLRGPFDVEVVGWIIKMGALAKMGWDADGAQYVEY